MGHRSSVSGKRNASRPSSGGSALRTTIQVGGELLLTAGVVMLLFVVWQLWWTNLEAGARQDEVVNSLADSYKTPLSPQSVDGKNNGTASKPKEDVGEPPVMDSVEYGEPIGIMYIPRFSEDYYRPIVSGTGTDVLDNLGLGHYRDTAMPGEVGNFAMAGHRQTNGKVLDKIDTLAPGDKLYVQTEDGYYTYEFKEHEIVLPHRSDVLLPVPSKPGADPTKRLMTLTSCHPRFGSEKRIIAYSEFESWQPLSAGPPSAITDQVTALQGEG